MRGSKEMIVFGERLSWSGGARCLRTVECTDTSLGESERRVRGHWEFQSVTSNRHVRGIHTHGTRIVSEPDSLDPHSQVGL